MARKGLRVSIFTDQFANKVPFMNLTLVGEGIDEVFEAGEYAPAVEIIPHRAGPQYNDIAVLVDGADSPAAFLSKAINGGGGRNWHMMSGAFIYTSDSRFPYDHPVALHNRYEVRA